MIYAVRMLRAEGPYSVGQVIPAMPGNMARMYEARGIGKIVAINGKPVDDNPPKRAPARLRKPAA